MSNFQHYSGEISNAFLFLMDYLHSLGSGINNGTLTVNMTTVMEALHQLTSSDLQLLYNITGAKSFQELVHLLNKSMTLKSTRIQEPDLTKFYQYNLSKMLLLYISPIILLIGTLGNTFSFVVLRRKPMAKVSTYIYLASLAITDTVVLYIGLLRLWLMELIGFDYHTTSDWVCKLCVLVGYVASNLSVWLIIAVTVERFIVVCFPFRANVMCNVSRAKKVILFLAFLILVIYLHFLWTVKVSSKDKCEASQDFVTLVESVWPWIDAGIYSFFPFVIIMILNVLIIKEVKGAQTNRVQMAASEYSSTPMNFQSPGASEHQRRQQCSEKARLTIMLLTVSFTFLLLTLPVNVMLIFTHYWNQNLDTNQSKYEMYQQSASFYLAKAIIELLMYTNHSINFFLYCATGHKFRQQVLLLFRCLRRISCCPVSGSSGKRALRKTSASIMGQMSDMTQTSRCGRRRSSCISLDVVETRLQNSCSPAKDDISPGGTLEVQVKVMNSSGEEILNNCRVTSDKMVVDHFPSSPKRSSNVRKLLLTMDDGGGTKKKGLSVRSYAKNGVSRFRKLKTSQPDISSSSSVTGCRVLYSSKKMNSAPVQRRVTRRYNTLEQQCRRDEDFGDSILSTHLGRVASSQF